MRWADPLEASVCVFVSLCKDTRSPALVLPLGGFRTRDVIFFVTSREVRVCNFNIPLGGKKCCAYKPKASDVSCEE